MGDAAGKVLPPVKGFRSISSSSSNVSKMDAMAIDMEVLSINPFWYGKDRDTAAAIVKMINEKLAELCASRPEGFGAFASLSLQFPDLAVQQIETAIRKQGLRRAAVGASVLGEDFSDPKFIRYGPRLKSSAPSYSSTRKARPNLPTLQGQWLAVQHDRQSVRHHDCPAAPDLRRTLDRDPGLKIIAAHGGYFGSYAARGDHACFVSQQNCNPNITLKKKPSDYLKQLTSMPWCSRRRACGISWRRSAQARSCSAPPTRSPGKNIRSTTSSRQSAHG